MTNALWQLGGCVNSHDDRAGFYFAGEFYEEATQLFIRPTEQNYHPKYKDKRGHVNSCNRQAL
jgi:hypothetical protein